MVAASLSKGGGLLLLSCCSRGVGGSPRPLISTCCSPSYYYYSPLFVKEKGKGNWNCDGMLTTGPLLLSVSISSSLDGPHKMATAAARRVFCCTASSNNAESATPVAPTTTSSAHLSYSSNDNDEGIKDAANTLDIRVGHILRVWRHEEADSLYVEEVDVGEPQPRIICSGLVNYMPLDHLQDKKVVVLANLKPRNMRGVKSHGMLMAASDVSHENVELLVPPEGALPGERVWFGSADEKENLPDTATPNQIQKKKIWELVQPHLRTDASCVASLGIHVMRTLAGVVLCRSLKNANIS